MSMGGKKGKGRPSKWPEVEERLDDVRQWAKAGATNREIAAALGIADSVFYQYQTDFPEFSDAIREGRMSGAAEVKTALLRLAVGYEATDTETRVEPGEDGKMHPVASKIFKRQVPPDLRAIEAYLRNSADEWSDMDSTTRMVKEAEAELKRMMASMQGFRCTPAWAISTGPMSGRGAARRSSARGF